MTPVGLPRELIAMRVAKELRDGMTVNLGIGLPTLVSNFLPEGVNITLHGENGILGYGGIAPQDEWDQDQINAGGQPVTLNPGASFFSSADSFAMIRGGHLDLAAGAKRVIVAMEHVTREGEPRILEECTYPLTARRCVNMIVTNLAVIDVTPEGLVLREVAPGV